MNDHMSTGGVGGPSQEYTEYLHLMAKDLAKGNDSPEKYRKVLVKSSQDEGLDGEAIAENVEDFVSLLQREDVEADRTLKKTLYRLGESLYHSHEEVDGLLALASKGKEKEKRKKEEERRQEEAAWQKAQAQKAFIKAAALFILAAIVAVIALRLAEGGLEIIGMFVLVLLMAASGYVKWMTWKRLMRLKKALQKPEKVYRLKLSGCDFQTLPESIVQLQNLKELSLSKNPDLDFDKSLQQLAALPNLQELNLGYNKLQTLPESIGQLQNLQKLSLWGNDLQILPESIGQLQNLQKLDLGSLFELQFLPESIGQLQNLQELNLHENKLQTLPESIGQLQNLQTLKLYRNDLQTLPESIGQLQNLKALNLWGNDLQTLPESIGQLQNLQALDFRDNPNLNVPQWLKKASFRVRWGTNY